MMKNDPESSAASEEAPATASATAQQKPRTIARAFLELAWWKKTLFALALVLLVGGIVLGTLSGDAPDAGAAGSPSAPGASAFVDGVSTPGAASSSEGSSGLGAYSPGMVKIGFGFVAGLSLGLFLRNFLRLTLSFVGLIVLAILGLEYVGFLEVHWDALGQGFDNLAAGLGDQFESFKTFVTGRIPAAGSAATGLYAGFRRG